MANHTDPKTEFSLLAAVCNGGFRAYLEATDFVHDGSFSVPANRIWWQCIGRVLEKNPDAVLDPMLLVAVATSLGYGDLVAAKNETDYLRSLARSTVNPANTREFARRVASLDVLRSLATILDSAADDVRSKTGDESVTDVVNGVESRLLEFSAGLEKGDGPVLLGAGAEDYLTKLAETGAPQGISTGWPHYDAAIGGGLLPNSVDLIAARAKGCKAQPLDATVHTPTGAKQMGDIQVGDLVCTPDGVSRVQAIFPQGPVEIFKVTFSDGDAVECCDDHLWEVVDCRKKIAYVLPLKELRQTLRYSNRGRWRVQLPKPCVRETKPVPLDAYVLGLLIGNGSYTVGSITFSTLDQELVSAIRAVMVPGYECKQITENDYRISHGAGRGRSESYYIKILRGLGLYGHDAHTKFIPRCYLDNSAEVRWAVLQGMMDTDGTASPGGKVSYCTVSPQLAADFKELVQSLGGLCAVRGRWTTCNGKKFYSYLCRPKLNDNRMCFRLARKKDRCHARTKPPLTREIASVESVGVKPAQCINLGDERGLYLTDNFVVTHNSLIKNSIAQHVAGKLGIPVLDVDTEMTREEQIRRHVAAITGLKERSIRDGLYKDQPETLALIKEGAHILSKWPYHHEFVGNKNIDEILATIRRWIVREVGLTPHGKAKPCLILFDYFKLTQSTDISRDMKEYQAYGFMATAIKNLMGRYDARCLALAQLNREGLDHEDERALAGADRLTHYCTSLTYQFWQSDDEKAEQPAGPDGRPPYDLKLVPLLSRHGGRWDRHNYIHVKADLNSCRLEEGPTRDELLQSAGGSFRATKGRGKEPKPVKF